MLLAIELDMSLPRSKRTDVHRPGALIPGHYESWNTYSLPSVGCPVPIGVDCTTPIPKFDGFMGWYFVVRLSN
jgi:hypothetical protein